MLLLYQNQDKHIFYCKFTLRTMYHVYIIWAYHYIDLLRDLANFKVSAKGYNRTSQINQVEIKYVGIWKELLIHSLNKQNSFVNHFLSQTTSSFTIHLNIFTKIKHTEILAVVLLLNLPQTLDKWSALMQWVITSYWKRDKYIHNLSFTTIYCFQRSMLQYRHFCQSAESTTIL
jgi:hypothetical protein